MNGRRAILISLLVVFALIASLSTTSAQHSITNSFGDVQCIEDNTTWKYTVYNDPDLNAISHWVVFWCDPSAILEVRVNNTLVPHCDAWTTGNWCWEYKTAEHPDPYTGAQGIKIEYLGGDFPPGELDSTINLSCLLYTSPSPRDRS